MKLATLCYVEKDGQYLMLHRNKKPGDMHLGVWVGLGGKFLPGESPEECVLREVAEESGLAIREPKLRGFITFPNDHGEDWYVFLFTADAFSGDLLDECAEGDLKWVPKSSLCDLPMHEGDRIFLHWIEARDGVFSAKFRYDENALAEYSMSWYE